ncbi:hypothetical protein EVAR_23555_1 [Eumeta japonica]|uniref:Uncharacterized protein n=1 Tax=Eumeta variegata TaxID=151549 RepID=A0A4C1X0C7_EUMVA|nr:hypothetical protein EVAR_23555_1 [Eumeta japonica]
MGQVNPIQALRCEVKRLWVDTPSSGVLGLRYFLSPDASGARFLNAADRLDVVSRPRYVICETLKAPAHVLFRSQPRSVCVWLTTVTRPKSGALLNLLTTYRYDVHGRGEYEVPQDRTGQAAFIVSAVGRYRDEQCGEPIRRTRWRPYGLRVRSWRCRRRRAKHVSPFVALSDSVVGVRNTAISQRRDRMTFVT